MPLCVSLAFAPEFAPEPCKYWDRCHNLHDLRKYLAEGRDGDLETWAGKCPQFDAYGVCSSGWRCRFVRSHMCETEHQDGRKELVLTSKPAPAEKAGSDAAGDVAEHDKEHGELKPGVVNAVRAGDKISLSRKRVQLDKSDQYIGWLNADTELYRQHYHKKREENHDESKDYRANYVEPPFKPSEKRKIYFGRDTPVLAPLTTQGNLPFRRLCVELGCQATYSEMAHGLDLLQGNKSDWTLMRAHEIEARPPSLSPDAPVVQSYDNARDTRFGVQIAAHTPWIAIKAAEALTRFLPHLRVIDVNCGCPIDNVFKTGAGSALLDTPPKLERMVRGMNAVSGEVPITAKIRTGVRDGHPTAKKLVERLAFGAPDLRRVSGAPGCAAITLHGRSRQQRYTRAADWAYIAECAAIVKRYNEQRDELTDTPRAPDESSLPSAGRMYFLGNGDCYSHEDYHAHLDEAGVDGVMIGRGALIKPWLFEEIAAGQYLDKSATERLSYVERFARYGLEAWGSDALGIGFTRRFLLEFMAFFHRYVPVGLLEYLPPSINDRPPAYRGRNELETLLASDDYRDWIKIRLASGSPCSCHRICPVHPM